MAQFPLPIPFAFVQEGVLVAALVGPNRLRATFPAAVVNNDALVNTNYYSIASPVGYPPLSIGEIIPVNGLSVDLILGGTMKNATYTLTVAGGVIAYA